MILKLAPLSENETLCANVWRLASREGLRTPFMLTDEMQRDFHRKVVCDRGSPHRYWAVKTEHGLMVAMAGLTGIQWENGVAEIALITDPGRQGARVGSGTVRLLLDEAFLRMRLLSVVGEVYECNPAVGFWKKMAERWGADWTTLPRRKWWDGKLWDAAWFTFTSEEYGRRCDSSS